MSIDSGRPTYFLHLENVFDPYTGECLADEDEDNG
jgi:hypothetical protein